MRVFGIIKLSLACYRPTFKTDVPYGRNESPAGSFSTCRRAFQVIFVPNFEVTLFSISQVPPPIFPNPNTTMLADLQRRTKVALFFVKKWNGL